MAAKNDPGGRWFNGSLGTVTRLNGADVFVRFDRTKDEHLVELASWEKVRQVWNEDIHAIENNIIGSYRQIPLVHGWASTVHKAQGLTLDDVRLDFAGGAFAPGQAYVALSRVRTMAGLSLAGRLRPTDFQADPMLLAFMGWMHTSGGSRYYSDLGASTVRLNS